MTREWKDLWLRETQLPLARSWSAPLHAQQFAICLIYSHFFTMSWLRACSYCPLTWNASMSHGAKESWDFLLFWWVLVLWLSFDNFPPVISLVPTRTAESTVSPHIPLTSCNEPKILLVDYIFNMLQCRCFKNYHWESLSSTGVETASTTLGTINSKVS